MEPKGHGAHGTIPRERGKDPSDSTLHPSRFWKPFRGYLGIEVSVEWMPRFQFMIPMHEWESLQEEGGGGEGEEEEEEEEEEEDEKKYT